MTNKISKCHICNTFYGSKRELRDHLDDNHVITDYHMAMTAAAADRIVDHILYSINDGGILGVAVIDWKGKVLSAKSIGSF